MEQNLHALYVLLHHERNFWAGTSVVNSTPRQIDTFMCAIEGLYEFLQQKNVSAFILFFDKEIGANKIRSCFRTNSALNHFAKHNRDEADRLLVGVCKRMLDLLEQPNIEQWAREKKFTPSEARRIFRYKQDEFEKDVSAPDVDDAVSSTNSTTGFSGMDEDFG